MRVLSSVIAIGGLFLASSACVAQDWSGMMMDYAQADAGRAAAHPRSSMSRSYGARTTVRPAAAARIDPRDCPRLTRIRGQMTEDQYRAYYAACM